MALPHDGGLLWDAARAERYLRGLELFGMKFGLARMRRLMAALGGPNERFAAIHVVGTNGKSSTTRMIAALLDRQGLATGTYTSPHLLSFFERIQLGGRDISPGSFAGAVSRVAAAAALLDAVRAEGDDPVTQFEALTAAAYAEFAAAGVSVAVVEAGLGGRYDATNVIDAKVAVLTNVALEHTRWLGGTIAEIATEKLDVVRPGSVLVLGPALEPQAVAVAQRVARERGARIVVAAPVSAGPLLARGAFQQSNLAVAVCAAAAFLGHPVDDAAIRGVAAELAVPGRFDVVGGDPVTVLDGAHNPSGATALAAGLPDFLAGRPLCLVVSILDDKDVRAMLAALMPLCSLLIATTASSSRALPAATLGACAGRLAVGQSVEIEPDPERALMRARAWVAPGVESGTGTGTGAAAGVVLVTGSLYLVADCMRLVKAGRGARS